MFFQELVVPNLTLLTSLWNRNSYRQNKFIVRDNKVFHKVEIDDKQTIKGVPFVPFAARADLVARYHESNEHAGLGTMIKLFVPRFWWPSLKRDLKGWVKTCPACQVNSRPGHTHHDVMHPLKVPSAFDQNRWLLVAVDYAINWPIARAVPFATKETIANFIYEEIMMRFGCPSEILTDRGSNFNSELVNAYLKRVGTHHKLTSAYHPRTNSKVERFNDVIKTMLRKYVNGALHRWDDFVNAALWASRIRVHTTTGFSPFYLTYGREPRLPGDPLLPYIDKKTFDDKRTVADITSRELASLGQHRAAAEFRMKAMVEKDKDKWDAKIKKVA
ncbi:Transposon Ty3-I Gag-Pol polyprotein, partial [Choanephora cucurbitarum]